MGTSYGVNRLKKTTPNISNRLKPGLFDGRVKIAYDEFTFVSETTDEIIEMFAKLPIGAKIIDVILDTVDLTNSATLKVGDYESTDRYIAAVDHGAGALVSRLDQNGGRMYEIVETTPGAITTDRQIIMTVVSGTATGLAKLIILYTHD